MILLLSKIEQFLELKFTIWQIRKDADEQRETNDKSSNKDVTFTDKHRYRALFKTRRYRILPMSEAGEEQRESNNKASNKCYFYW